ncbi:MAG: hypothetical protein V4713_14100 [Pseudomonadota bacterium]
MNMIDTSLDAAGADPVVAAAPPVLTYRLIREARAPKMGPHSSGQIVYQILTNESRQVLFLRIAANEGGGYVSDEAVCVDAIVRCTDLEVGQVLRSGAFKPAFTGRSSNNAGFLTAILLAEGLLSRDAERPHALTDLGQWQDWCARQLAVDGDLPCVRIGKEDVAAAPPPPATQADAAEVSGVDPDPGPATDEPGDAEPALPARKGRKGRAADHG